MVVPDFKPSIWETKRWIYIWGQPGLQSKSKVSYTEKLVLNNNNNKRTFVVQTMFGGEFCKLPFLLQVRFILRLRKIQEKGKNILHRIHSYRL